MPPKTKGDVGRHAHALCPCPSVGYPTGTAFLDEAFSALDALTRKQIYGLFLDLYERRPFSALLVTHDLDEAVFLSDEVWFLRDLAPKNAACSLSSNPALVLGLEAH